jgi:hypothetical protein
MDSIDGVDILVQYMSPISRVFAFVMRGSAGVYFGDRLSSTQKKYDMSL